MDVFEEISVEQAQFDLFQGLRTNVNNLAVPQSACRPPRFG